MAANREWVFVRRPGPEGFAPTDLELRSCVMPTCGEGQVLLATHLMSMDPTMRNAMAGSTAAERTDGSVYYNFMNWQPGSVISWRVVSQVLESRADGFAKGDFVFGAVPWREFNAVSPEGLSKTQDGVSPSASMSCLGTTAATGYLGVTKIARPQEGDVAFVSGAAGATGLIACHTLKQRGCRVVGSAGSNEKVELLKSHGFEAFNYKEESVLVALRRLCPDGLNICFENVGGETLEAVLEMMNDGGCVALCGAISQYDKPPDQRYGVRNLFHIVAKRLRVEGFLVLQFTNEEHEECQQTLVSWLRDGKISDCSTFVDGFENLPDAILGLFRGTNTGKMLVRLPLASPKL